MTNEESNFVFNDYEKAEEKQKTIDSIVNDLKNCHKTSTYKIPPTQNIKQYFCSLEMTEEQKESSRKLSQALEKVYEKHGHPSCAEQIHNLMKENTILKIEPTPSSSFISMSQTDYPNLKQISTFHQKNPVSKPIFTNCTNYSTHWNQPVYNATSYNFSQNTHTNFFQPSCNSNEFQSSTPETSLSQLMIEDLNTNVDEKKFNFTAPATSIHSLPYPTHTMIAKSASNHANRHAFSQPLSQFMPYNLDNKFFDPTQSSLSSSLPVSQFSQNDLEFFPKSSSFSDFSKKSKKFYIFKSKIFKFKVFFNKINFTGFSGLDLEEQEKLRLERKRAKNRIAAQKCQQRKIEKISYLENQVSELRKRNKIYETKTEQLRGSIEALKYDIHLHFTKGCLSLSDYNHTTLIPVTSQSGLGN